MQKGSRKKLKTGWHPKKIGKGMTWYVIRRRSHLTYLKNMLKAKIDLLEEQVGTFSGKIHDDLFFEDKIQ